MKNKQEKVLKIPSDEETCESTRTYFETREELRKQAKLKIAKKIVKDFLHEGDSILIDAGTSLYPIAQEIVNQAKENTERTHFTIITHNYSAFQTLVEDVPRDANLNIVLSGGRYDRDLNALFGPQTIMAYEYFFPKVVLIGISGMVADIGLFCHGNTEELAVKEVIFNKGARDRIIVADYTKLGIPDALRFGEAQNFKANVDNCIIVTDVPEKTEKKEIRDKVESELDKLRNVYRVKVETI
ncbi:MAG: DeoR/GlpR transcriptional regulator [Tissierellales bacterium]|nr:DeoR/GlpR transcriptional regulator [Tissierellales bacterium]